jgi:hypothetical protein
MNEYEPLQPVVSDDQLTSLTTQLRHKDRLALMELGRLMVAVRNGSVDPKLSMAYKNVDNILNANPEWTFEDMGEHRPNKSWRTVDEVIQRYKLSFRELGLRLALIESIR